MQRRWLSTVGAVLCIILLSTACAATTEVVEPSAPAEPTAAVPTETPGSIATDATPSPTADASSAQTPSATSTPEPAPSTAEPWASDLAPAAPLPAGWAETVALDPRSEEAVLDNGLRVIVRRNTAPGSQAQLRLVVDAGSLEEDPSHLGSAHFLEHMMFNGTERFPGNELIPVLEGFGAGFGPDVNAYTSFSETVYQLTVPSRDPAVVRLGLEVLGEWAARATVADEAVDAERGVIREEWRRRAETVGGRLRDDIRSALLPDSRYLGRDPIGPIDSIERLQGEDLRAFYDRWYRPDLMTVIVVGDIDVATTLAEIERVFAPLGNPEAERPVPVVDEANGPLPEPVIDVIVDDELSRTELEVLWRVDGGPLLTLADAHRELVSAVAMTVLDLRLFEAGERARTVARSSSARRSGLTSLLDAIAMRGVVEPDDVEALLVEFVVAAEQMRQHPVDDDEFERAIERLRSGFEQDFAESGAAQDNALAVEYVEYALGESVVMAPEARRDAALEVLDSITVDDLRRLFDAVLSTPPYVLVTAPAIDRDRLPAPELLFDRYEENVGRVVPAPSGSDDGPDVLLEPPEPAVEVERERIEALSTTVVTYGNGARVAVRPTTIVENRVEFEAWSRGGFFQAEAPVAALLGRAANLVLPSGFAAIDAVALDRLLSGRVVGLGADVGRASETLSGEAATGDLETLMQLIHLQMTQSTIGPVAVDRFEESWRPLAENPEVRPTIAADLELWRLRYGDSPYFRLIPTVADLDELDPDAQLAAWTERFANAADFVFVFVGDVDPAAVFDLAARYIGTLPADEGRESAVDRDPGLPEENLVSTVAVGVGEQGRLRINWESPLPFTLEAEVAAGVLEVVVDARLRDLVREELGASYAPSAAVTVLSEPKPWVDTIIEIDTDPERIAEVSDVIRAELERIRSGEIDQGYVDRAVDQVVEGYRFFSNPEWIDLITFHLANPDRPADEFRRRADIAAALTVADLAATAQVVFPATRSVEVRMVPAG